MRPPLALAALLLLLLHGGAHACTTIIVGRRASADGSVLAARNVDYSGNANITDILHWHAPRKDAASFASNENDFEVELPGEAPGYFAFPHPCEGPCSETGTNYTFEEAGAPRGGEVGWGRASVATALPDPTHPTRPPLIPHCQASTHLAWPSPLLRPSSHPRRRWPLTR